MNKLHLSFARKDYPYQDEPHDPDIKWGRFMLYIQNDEKDVVKEIFTIEWDIREFLEWLQESRNEILNEFFPQQYSKGDSIAESVFSFYNSEEDYEDKAYDIMYNYIAHHGIQFGLRGTTIDSFYLGRILNGYEISFFNQNHSWRFDIDMESFYDEIELMYGQL